MADLFLSSSTVEMWARLRATPDTLNPAGKSRNLRHLGISLIDVSESPGFQFAAL